MLLEVFITWYMFLWRNIYLIVPFVSLILYHNIYFLVSLAGLSLGIVSVFTGLYKWNIALGKYKTWHIKKITLWLRQMFILFNYSYGKSKILLEVFHFETEIRPFVGMYFKTGWKISNESLVRAVKNSSRLVLIRVGPAYLLTYFLDKFRRDVYFKIIQLYRGRIIEK